MASQYERTVAAQLGLAEVLMTFGVLRAKGTVPAPRKFLAMTLPFLALSLLELADERWQRIGKNFGWLIVLAMGMYVIPAPAPPAGSPPGTPPSPDLLTWIVSIGFSKSPLFPPYNQPGQGPQTLV